MKTRSGSLEVLEFEPTTGRRGRAERMWSRAHLLSTDDQTLLRLHLDGGHSFSQIGRLLGLRPSTVGRRLRRITERLADPTYPLCVRYRHRFSHIELIVIRDFFVRGRSVQQISAARNVSYYASRAAVRKARKFVAANRAAPADTTVAFRKEAP